jgi:hypothetical protein
LGVSEADRLRLGPDYDWSRDPQSMLQCLDVQFIDVFVYLVSFVQMLLNLNVIFISFFPTVFVCAYFIAVCFFPHLQKGKDELLIEEGKRNEKLIRVKSGSIRIQFSKDNFKELGPGTVVGDTAVLKGIYNIILLLSYFGGLIYLVQDFLVMGFNGHYIDL